MPEIEEIERTLRDPASGLLERIVRDIGLYTVGLLFVLARIAGHSSITVTQRYIHPQADAINRVFAAWLVGTKLGTSKETPKLKQSKKVRRVNVSA